jgi:protocatechuate 3,4-dioxygenase alpha subunit
VEPGPTTQGSAPFIAVTVFARGLLNRLFTRIYLPVDTAVIDADPFLSGLDEQERQSMIAVRESDGSLRFDITLQGPDQSVFLTFPRHQE